MREENLYADGKLETINFPGECKKLLGFHM